MLSVIIPTLNAETHLPDILAQVQDVAEDVVVSDGGSIDKTLAQSVSQNVRIAIGCSGRGWQLARGAEWARGDWLLFLHADTALSEGWEKSVRDHMQNFPQKAGYFRFALSAKGIRPRLLTFGVRVRSRLLALPYGDQGLLISRPLYEEVGGFPDWDLFEDVAIIKALGRGRLRRLSASAITSAERYEQQGYIRRSLRNLGLITRFSFGADPQKLKERYYK